MVMRQLQRKKVGVGAGTIKNALVPAYFIHKKPIRFYMQLPVRFPLSFEGMVTTMLGQLFLVKQKHDYCFQLLHIVAAMFHLSQITAKLSGKSGITHLYPQLSEKVFRILGVKYFLSPFRLLYGFTGQGIGTFSTERQALLMGHPGQCHAAEVGYRQPHFRKHGCRFILDDRVNSGTNIVIGRHRSSPCFQYCSSHEHKVNLISNTGIEGSHGLI